MRVAVDAYWRKMNAQDDWRRHVNHEGEWPNLSGCKVFTEETIRWREPVLDDQGGAGLRWRVFTRLELISISKSIEHLSGWDDVKGFASTIDEIVLRLMDFDETLGLGEDFAEQLSIASYDQTDPLIDFVDWNMSDVDLIQKFKQLLKTRRPTPLENPKSQGREKTPEKNELRALGALRLLRHYGSQPDVMTALSLRRARGETLLIPYTAAGNWSDAKRTANDALNHLVRNVRDAK